MLPGVIVSERPVVPPRKSCGRAQSGPVARGKRMKNATMSGSDCSSSPPAGRSRSASVGELPMRLKPTSVAMKIHTHTSM